jgi:hypothetical protein
MAVAALLSLSAAAPAAAQTSDGLAGLLLRFFSPTNPVVLRDNPNPALSHAAHFVSQTDARESLQQINQSLASQLGSFPLGSSSAGFAFSFDPALGVFNRSTESFGPTFAERPFTAGKGKFSFGVNYQRATYDRLDGQELRDGDLQLQLVHQDINQDGRLFDPWFEGDLVAANLSIDLVNETTVLYANYGVSDRFDLSLAIPYVHIDLDAAIDTRIDRVASSVDPFVVHVFDDGRDEHTYRESGSASGIGDLVVRGKYNLTRGASWSFAGAFDLRLPTGDDNDLLGSGATQIKPYLIGAYLGGARFSPRASLGYTFSSGGADFIGELPDEINYTAGFDAVLHPRVTLSADFLGRRLLDANRIVLREGTYTYRLRTDPTPQTTTRVATAIERSDVNVLLGVAGLKINPVGRLLIVASALIGLGDGGLQDTFTPVVGLEYDF